MRYVIRLVGAICCALGLWVATPGVQAGPQEDCAQTQDLDRTIRGCTQVLQQNPRDKSKRILAYVNRAVAHHAKGDYDSAVADYSEVIKLVSATGAKSDPRLAAIYKYRGDAYTTKGDYDRAVADATKAIGLNPSDADAYILRGASHYEKGDYDRSIADLNEAIRLNPSDFVAHNNRGSAYSYKGDHARAIADLNEAIKLKPSDPFAYANRGKAYHGKGDYSRAMADHNEAIRLNPSEYAFYLYRGETHEATGDRDKAMVDYTKALGLPAPSKWDKDKQAEAAKRLAKLQGTSPAVAPAAPAPVAPVAPPAVAPQDPKRAAGRRVALVIGNSVYGAIERLANPANDARAVAASLRRLGFADVVERYDLGLAAMVDALKSFGDKSADADWAIVYYAGHGIEMGGTTYLIPTDARFLRDAHVIDEALPLDRVLAKVETARKLRLVILDACRNNPFMARMAHAKGSGRSIGRGLARIEPEGGVIVAYAAKHGTIAQDGRAGHSPFTEALLAHLEEPGLEINFLFRKVRDRVLDRTGKAQEPFIYGSLGSEPLYFKISDAR